MYTPINHISIHVSMFCSRLVVFSDLKIALVMLDTSNANPNARYNIEIQNIVIPNICS